MHTGDLRIWLALALASSLGGCSSDDPCSRATCLETLPWQGMGSTVDADEAEISTYACGASGLDGREVLYHFNVDELGFLAAEAKPIEGATAPSLHLLGAPSGEACLDGGLVRAGGLLTPGEYWLVVDSNAGAEGAYELRVGLTTETDLEAQAMQQAAAHDALAVMGAAWERRDTERFEYVVTDFSLHSGLEREWIFDLTSEELLFHLHVAHGRGSNEAFMDTAYPPAFSNVPGSHLSSLGVMKSGEAYEGAYGSSFRIDGIEPDLNDNVRDRAIVMHPWEGSRPEFVTEHGEVQPTWGCPALDDRVAPMVADLLHDGVLMFFWHPEWRDHSTYLSAAQ